MSETKDELWCVNVQGPDDVIAVRDYFVAVVLANILNALFEQHFAPKRDPNDPHMWAVPIRWPHSAEGHANDMANPSVDYAAQISDAIHKVAERSKP